MTIHKLKLNAAYYDDSASGIKTFPYCQHRFFNNYKRITVNENSNNTIDI